MALILVAYAFSWSFVVVVAWSWVRRMLTNSWLAIVVLC